MIKIAEKILTLISDNLGQKAVIVALVGPLGAGKTTLTKELAKIMGVKDAISSPTFVLHIPHQGKNNLKFHHIDCWRMEDFTELKQIGLEQMLSEKAVIVIEWADKFKSQITDLKSQAKIIWVTIEYAKNEKERIVNINE